MIYPLPGTRFRDTFLRGGPTPEFAAHVLGRFGEITAERLEELGEPYQAGDLVGLTGLEAAYEEQLAGTPSSTVRVVGADDEVVDEVERFEGRAPQPLRTTIDPAVQTAVEEALGDTTTPLAVVVVDAKSNVRAVALRPLGEFNRAIGGEYRPARRSRSSPPAPCWPAVSRPTPPSSARLTVNAGGSEFRNFESSSLGNVPFGLAFAQSCNTAFISTSADVADADLVAAAENFGFNTDYSIGLDTATGSFPTPADPTEHAAAVIGQGKVTASPLHMATVGATVLDGTWEPPVLLPERDADDAPAATSLAAGASDTLYGLMRRVVTEGSGRAAAVPGAEVAGKTGTAEYDAGDPPPPMPGSWGCGASCRWRCWSRTASRAARSPRPSPGASSPACPGELGRRGYVAAMTVLTPEARDVITAGRLAHLSTVNADGSPQVSIVWVGLDGDEIVSGHLGMRQKLRNVQREPRVVLSLETGHRNAMGLDEYLVVRGTARVTEGGAPELLQRLAEVYLGPGTRFPPFDDPPARLRAAHHPRGGGRRRALVVLTPTAASVGSERFEVPAGRVEVQLATIVAASAIRWSFAQGGPIVARGPSRTSSARSPSTPAAWPSTSLAS